ncbi:MAG: acetate kinase [Desulfovibrio sp.]|nr:acetate kinase [Desulfovibrio sp.]
MNVLVINSGSSSCKYRLLDMATETLLCSGLAERIGDPSSGCLVHETFKDGKERKVRREHPFPTHVAAMEEIIALLTDPEVGVIADRGEIGAIGHRVVHGGVEVTEPVLVDEKVKDIIRRRSVLSPLHNPANLKGIEVAEELFPGTPNVAVFDTEFGTGMPEEAYMYALPYDCYEELGVRRYGSHGTSHKYVAWATAKYLGKPLAELDSITMHLGNGSSMTCVRNGKCLDSSMGLGTVEGLVMGTRCGSIDPSIIPFLMEKKGLSTAEVSELMYKRSGMLGICGHTDMRDIHALIAAGDRKASLALKLYVRSIRKMLGAYFFLLGGRPDAIVFTAGIGTNDAITRAAVCEGLEPLGLVLDPAANDTRTSGPRTISTKDSRVPILVIPTNEELQIAMAAVQILGKAS